MKLLFRFLLCIIAAYSSGCSTARINNYDTKPPAYSCEKQDTPDRDYQKKTNNFWCRNNNSDTVFVFVHGIFSNAKDAWLADNGAYWPEILAILIKPSNKTFLSGFLYNKKAV